MHGIFSHPELQIIQMTVQLAAGVQFVMIARSDYLSIIQYHNLICIDHG
jgi:hypothetical protein